MPSDSSEANLQAPDSLDWQQYCQMLQSYEFYWNSALKVCAFFYTLSGVVGAFYLTHRDIPNLQWVMLFPVFLGLILFWIFSLFAYGCQTSFQNCLADLARNCNRDYWKNVSPLTTLLCLNAAGFLGVCVFMTVAFSIFSPRLIDQGKNTQTNQRNYRNHPQNKLQPKFIRHYNHGPHP